MDEIIEMLEEIGLPYAYDHFAEGEVPDVPYLIYRVPGAANFAADGLPYFKVNEINFELYTEKKDLAAEAAVEAVLDEYTFYDKSETWIPSEELYEVLYSFDWEGLNDA